VFELELDGGRVRLAEAVRLPRGPAALLIAYGGSRTSCTALAAEVELTNMGGLESGGGFVRGGGRFWLLACWNGSVHG